MRRRPFGWLVLFFFIIALQAACSPVSSHPTNGEAKLISAGSSFGQSFTAQNRGLTGVAVLMAPATLPGSGNLVFHLRSGLQSADDLAVTRLSLAQITQKAYYHFDFPAQKESLRRDYFVFIEIEGEGQVLAYTGPADSYLDGAFYEDNIPQEGQLQFWLDYAPLQLGLGIASLIVKWLGVLGVGVFAFVIPGWALFSLLWHGWNELSFWIKLGLASGLSLAIYPLCILWTGVIGLQLGAFYAWLPAIAGLIAVGWKTRHLLAPLRNHPRRIFQNVNLSRTITRIDLADVAAAVTLTLVIITRMWVTQSIDVPLFGDSLQHTMITQLMIDHGGLFSSWEPYADLGSFTYHFGFHSLAAVFHWISGASSTRAVLWTGQLVNILAIIGLYPLAYKITHRKWAGVIAMLVGGLLSSTPMIYINWGRYTQLASQAMLPAVVFIAWTYLDRVAPGNHSQPSDQETGNKRTLRFDMGALWVSWLALSGMALTHYRLLILTTVFFPAYFLLSVRRRNIVQLLLHITITGIGAAVLFLPWLIHIYSGKLLSIFTAQLSNPPANPASGSVILSTISSLRTYLPDGLWILLAACAIWGIWKRKRELFIFILWWLFIVLAANPQWLGLPGATVIGNFAIFIAVYFPAAVIAGVASEWLPWLSQLFGRLVARVSTSKWRLRLVNSLSFVIVIGTGIWALPQRTLDLDLPTYSLVTRPDLRAMAWIDGATPKDALFLVNSFFAYNNTLVAGSDGGWWLPLLADRKTTLPPLTYGFEESVGMSSVIETNDLSRAIQEKGITDSKVISLLHDRGVGYIYIGQRQGRINYQGPDVLDPQVISADAHFTSIYHQDRVWIFRIEP